MKRAVWYLLVSFLGTILGSSILWAQRSGSAGARPAPTGGFGPNQVAGVGPNSSVAFTPFVNSFFYPSFGWFGGYASPFLYFPSLPPAAPYLPPYWWTGGAPSADPRQEGYNPSAGYRPETVTTLLLETFPAKSRVILDGVFVGTSDFLGPIQLPVGDHSLRVEALGYEPSETVLKVERPEIQQLEVRLKAESHTAKPGPRK